MAFVEGLSEICRQLLMLAGLSLFMEVLLPGGDLKKYAQFVMGLLVVAALLNPLLGLTKGLTPDVVAKVFTDIAETTEADVRDNTDDIIAAGTSLDNGARVVAAQRLAESLERQIASLCSLAAGVRESRVQVELSDDAAAAGGAGHNWGRVVIVLTVAADAQTEKETICREIRQRIADFYDIEPGAVQVSVAEYGES